MFSRLVGNIVVYEVIDSLGDIYTGLGDGRIIRINKDLSSYQTVARTGDPPYDSCGE